MSTKSELKLVENFIYNDEVQNILSKINDNVMDFNILEITGMGTQEIRHSNILGWLFDDSEHNLEYQILDGFLKEVVKEKDNQCNKLHEYIYLANKKRDITIYREKDNIDLLIVDEANKIIIAIENKVYANERTDGEDGGQLQKYENKINKNYNEAYDKYFIFLTIDLEEPSKEDWLKASHQMLSDVIENILKLREISIKTKIVLESYVDLLKRNGIVENEKLKELSEKIWSNKEYRDALNILIDNKPNNVVKISEIIINQLKEHNIEFYIDGYNGIYIRSNNISPDLYNEDQLYFFLSFGYDGIFIKIYINTDNEKFDNLYHSLFPKKNKRTYSNMLMSVRNNDWYEYVYDIGIENLEEEISGDLEKIFAEIYRCDDIIKKELLNGHKAVQ